jgi:hypothetical protein
MKQAQYQTLSVKLDELAAHFSIAASQAALICTLLFAFWQGLGTFHPPLA